MEPRYECCNYCLRYGPVKLDGTMRRHRPPMGREWGTRQDISADICAGSGQPPAVMIDSQPTQEKEERS